MESINDFIDTFKNTTAKRLFTGQILKGVSGSSGSSGEYDQSFRNTKSFSERKQQARTLREKYPTRYPIIIESHVDLQLDKKKYLVPYDLTIGQLFYLIRNRLKIPPEQGLFFFNEYGSIPPISDTLEKVYKSSHNEDGFLYFKLTSETAFG